MKIPRTIYYGTRKLIIDNSLLNKNNKNDNKTNPKNKVLLPLTKTKYYKIHNKL